MAILKTGIVLPFHKGDAAQKPIENYTVQSTVRVPLVRLDTNTPMPSITFDENTRFKAGSVLYQEAGELPVLSPVCSAFGGTVVLTHPQYGKLLCAELHPLDDNAEETLLPHTIDELTADDIIAIAREAAIYDELDGIPLAEKLAAWQLPPNDTDAPHFVMVADGTENDVYGSAAWAVLAAQPDMVLTGLKLAAKATNFTRYHIATMLPKAQRRALKRAIGRVNVYTVEDEYPVTQYADKRDEVFIIGVQACLALGKAVYDGKKALTTVVTVAGDGVAHARNLRIPYGVNVDEIFSSLDTRTDCTAILGDAMTGVACTDKHIPLLPGTTTLLGMVPRTPTLPSPCIGCGRCAAVCHAGLLPYEIVRRAENMHYARLRRLTPRLCDGCGACSYICPSGRDVAAAVLRAGESSGPVFLNWGDEENE